MYDGGAAAASFLSQPENPKKKYTFKTRWNLMIFFCRDKKFKNYPPLPLRRRTPSLSLPFSACCCCCVVFFSSSCHRRSPKKQKSYTSTNTYTILKILKIHQPKKLLKSFCWIFFKKIFLCVLRSIDRFELKEDERRHRTQSIKI